MTEDARIVRSARKTLAVEIQRDGSVLVRAPFFVSEREIQRFLESRAEWIQKHRELVLKRRSEALPMPDEAQLKELYRQAREHITTRVAYYAPLVGVSYGRISIRCQRSRWGSCSSRGNLSFNCLLMLTSPDIIDYVVVHELCHRLEMNHSERFWREVERVYPDWRNARHRLSSIHF